MKFTKVPLAYDLDALEPYISKKTMDLHHNKHHEGYKNKLNEILETLTDVPDKIDQNDLTSLMKNYFHIKDKKAVVIIRRMGGGLINHDLFFSLLKKDTILRADMPFYQALVHHFGDFAKFKEIFVRHASQLFGSGWTWLVLTHDGKFRITTTANQDNPWMIRNVVQPILGIDLWEHSYYVDYQNNRAAYIEAFFNVVNWDRVNELYVKGMNLINDKSSSSNVEDSVIKF